jgi:hypothetical protein
MFVQMNCHVQFPPGDRGKMAESKWERVRSTTRLTHIKEILEQNFPDVEHVGIRRFLVWGSREFNYRPYIEIWFDQDFLDQGEDCFEACIQRIVREAEAVLNNPDQGVRKQGEILASGMNGIKVRRGIHLYSLTHAHDSRSDGPRPE